MKRLSDVHPVFYHARVGQKRMARHLRDWLMGRQFAGKRQAENLAFPCYRHQSLLRRKLGSTDPQLQENKVVNLHLALQRLDGLIVAPGQVFSFWRQIGCATARKGYLPGLVLSQGNVATGVGGGLCQLANLLYWMALHTPLEVAERHHHSFNPFPDEGRTLPFGSGASVFYNYVDLRFRNSTSQSFQFRVWLTESHLKGAVFSDRELALTYHIVEKNHRFLEHQGKTYRENEIWREIRDRATGAMCCEELLIRNFAEVKYSLINPHTTTHQTTDSAMTRR